MIYLSSDHAGFELKEAVRKFLTEKSYEFEDLGPDSQNPLDDYPNLIFPLAKKVATNADNRGVIFGLSGQGEAMVANKVKGTRAVVYYGREMEIIKLSREHNDANILSIGAGFVKVEEAVEAVTTWLSTPFSGEERHVRRLNEIVEIEEKS